MDPDSRQRLIARSAARLAAKQLARVEQAIAERGLRPESARLLWHWRGVLADLGSRLEAR
jgi:hypothetical protein